MYLLDSRAIIKVKGKGGEEFLQRLITGDILNLPKEEFRFSALLNSSSKFLYDFFIYKTEEEVQIDIAKNEALNFQETLKNYDLLGEIDIQIDKNLYIAVDEDFFLNWKAGVFKGRKITSEKIFGCKREEEYHANRIKFCLPDGFLELTKEKSFIQEYGYDEAGAISFTKGCYIGQEFITRTKRMGKVRKKLYCIDTGSDQLPIGEKLEGGKILSIYNNYALLIWQEELIKEGKIFIGDRGYVCISHS